jgi:hypothetical protein
MSLAELQPQLAAALALSLLGGVHCAGMCGGFVGALQMHRPKHLAALPYAAAYHLGRIGAYGAAGAVIGGIGATLFGADVLPAQITLLVLASIFLGLVGASLIGSEAALRPLERLGGRLWGLLQPLARRVLPPRSLPGAVLAGFVWGWIPCGMVYAALPLALISGSVAAGASVMLVFGLGTLPNLGVLDLGAGLLAKSSAWRSARSRLRPIAGCVLLLFAASDLAHAARLTGHHNSAILALASICHARR